VLVLLVGAFAGYGAWSRSRPTHYARGGSFAVDDPAATASPLPSATSLTGVTAPKPTTTAMPGAAASAMPSATAGNTTLTGTAPGGVAPAAVDDAIVTPRTGAYQVQVSGSEHVKFGPFSACTNTFPASTQLVVQRAAGEPSGSFNFDQRYFPATANKHDERHIYRYTKSTVTLTYEEATVTCSGIKQSTTVNYDPAQTRIQLPLTVGATWHSHGGDANRTEDASSKIAGTTHLTVAGRSYLTYVIDTRIAMSGSESGTRDQRWWWAPALGVPLKWSESLSGSRSGASYSADVTCTVSKLP
jgi:hypothetical protein